MTVSAPRFIEPAEHAQGAALIAAAFRDDPLFRYWCQRPEPGYAAQCDGMADILNQLQEPKAGHSIGNFDGRTLGGLAYLKDAAQLQSMDGFAPILWQVWRRCGFATLLRFLRVGAELPRHWPAGRFLYLSLLAVRPAQQGRGLGKALLAACEEFALRHGYDLLCLDTQNPANVGYYRAQGYRVRKQLQIGSLSSWSMEKPLA